jgi:polysaccharide pyruvyl transferase WcaK-like protein
MTDDRPVMSIVGLTVTGNKGAESMLLAIMAEMERRVGRCRFDLVTVYPDQDRRAPLPENLRLVPGRPLTMLGVVLPLSLLLRPLLGLRPVRRLLRRHGVFRSFLDADLILDSSGVAFVDGRGWPMLAFNLSLCVPPKLLGKPVIKLAQALGPFRRPFNRRLARWALGKVDVVIGRGEITGEHLRELGLTGAHVCTDTAFLMPVGEDDEREAERRLPPSAPGRRRVGVSPSVVVDDYCRSRGLDYAGTLARFIEHAHGRGFDVVLVPHSIRRDARRRKNNDLLICREVVARFGGSVPVTSIDEELTAPALRALIGRMDLFLASRFHAMVSALAAGVPTLLIGWSHKYREVMRQFDVEEWALGYEQVSAEEVIDRFDRLLREERDVRERIVGHLEEVRASAGRNFDLAVRLLAADGGRRSGGPPRLS